MRAVLDTNVVVSATLVRGRTEDRILRAWRRQTFELVLSVEILVEMGRVLLSPRIRRLRWMTDEEVVSLLELLATESLTVLGRLPVRVCRDPDDDKFLAAAIEGEAEYVVTGDRDLLAVRRYRSVRVMTPGEFLRLIR